MLVLSYNKQLYWELWIILGITANKPQLVILMVGAGSQLYGQQLVAMLVVFNCGYVVGRIQYSVITNLGIKWMDSTVECIC